MFGINFWKVSGHPTYRAQYTRKRFRLYYESSPDQQNDYNPTNKTFDYPFHELLIWAVLMKRQEMAIFMWQQGEEALAKSLVAMKLYKRMAQEAEDDDVNQEEIQILRNSAEVFKQKSLELLKLGYKESDKMCYQVGFHAVWKITCYIFYIHFINNNWKFPMYYILA